MKSALGSVKLGVIDGVSTAAHTTCGSFSGSSFMIA
jgi:hypothetical protein